MFIIKNNKKQFNKALLVSIIKTTQLIPAGSVKDTGIGLKAVNSSLNYLLKILKKHSLYRFDFLTDLFGTDTLLNLRFCIKYILNSLLFNKTLKISLFASTVSGVPTVYPIHSVADRLEREA
jgi:NADH:ubiquinone oxidoreductase subunit C